MWVNDRFINVSYANLLWSLLSKKGDVWYPKSIRRLARLFVLDVSFVAKRTLDGE